MSSLSPATQAILTAQAKARCLIEWDTTNDPPCHPSDADWNGCVRCIDRRGLAAAFRALAERIHGANAIRQDVLNIAAELEGQP